MPGRTPLDELSSLPRRAGVREAVCTSALEESHRLLAVADRGDRALARGDGGRAKKPLVPRRPAPAGLARR